MALFEPSQLSTKKTHSVTYGKKLTKYYSILINNDGKKVTIAEDIKGKNVADLLLERITKQIFPSRLQ